MRSLVFDAIRTSSDSASSSVAFDAWLIFETVRLYEGRALLSLRSSGGGKVRQIKSKVTLRSLISQSINASSDRQSPNSPEGSKENTEMKSWSASGLFTKCLRMLTQEHSLALRPRDNYWYKVLVISFFICLTTRGWVASFFPHCLIFLPTVYRKSRHFKTTFSTSGDLNSTIPSLTVQQLTTRLWLTPPKF